MRKILLLFTVFCCFFSRIYAINDITEKALAAMQQGYIQYAVQQLQRAVSVNDIAAQFYMGQCYESGIGIAANVNAAFLMYRRAAERGLPEAMFELVRCYKQGVGVAANVTRANEWQQRYDKRNKGSKLPNLIEIYQKGLSYQENFALNPNETTISSERQVISAIPTAPVSQQFITTPVEQPLAVLNGTPEPEVVVKSDVDIEIPTTQKVNENVFALIIANENYQDVAKVSNAINDGSIFAQYCQNVLGMPTTNIHLVKDATLNNIKREMNLFKQIGEAYGGKASFIIYYAGHGIPDESTRNAFLLPIDGYVADLSTCYSLSDFYNVIGGIPSAQTVIFLDACFSGTTRGDGMLASARGVAIKPKMGALSGNTLVISSAQGDETAYPYEEKQHGLFTYFLLKKLKESRGEVTLGSLVDYVHDNVTKMSLVVNGKSQTPSTIASEAITNEWKSWKLY